MGVVPRVRCWVRVLSIRPMLSVSREPGANMGAAEMMVQTGSPSVDVDRQGTIVSGVLSGMRKMPKGKLDKASNGYKVVSQLTEKECHPRGVISDESNQKGPARFVHKHKRKSSRLASTGNGLSIATSSFNKES